MDVRKLVLNPILWLIVVVLVFSVRSMQIAINDEYLGETAGRAYSYVVGYIAACWVWRDMRKRSEFVPTDMVMLFPVIFIPSYLWRTRKWKGVGVLSGIVAILVLLTLVENLIYDIIFMSKYS